MRIKSGNQIQGTGETPPQRITSDSSTTTEIKPWYISHPNVAVKLQERLYGIVGREEMEHLTRIIQDVVKTVPTNDTTFDQAVEDVARNFFEDQDRRMSQKTAAVQGCATRPQDPESPGLPTSSSTMETSTVTLSTSPFGINEERDLNKAIELSLVEDEKTKTRFIPKFEHNPADDRRTPGSPSGIKNVGQTCWFSVLSQVLFHLPNFRQFIYNSTPRNWDSRFGKDLGVEDKKAFLEPKHLLVALRRLFTELQAGGRNAADPSDILDSVTAIKGPGVIVGTQQDASEMLEFIIDRLEVAMSEVQADQENRIIQTPTFPAQTIPTRDAVPHSSSFSVSSPHPVEEEAMETVFGSPPPPRKLSHNEQKSEEPFTVIPADVEPWEVVKRPGAPSISPLAQPLRDMFYASSVSMDSNGTCVPLKSSFELLNLNVEYGNLHDALEYYCLNAVHSKQRWLTQPAPVMFIALNRYLFESGTKKLHSPFNFPKSFFMDRYLHKNISTVQPLMTKREDLRKQLSEVRAKIEGYEQFPLNKDGKVGKLQDIIHSFMWFASGQAQNYSLPLDEPMSEDTTTGSFSPLVPKCHRVLPGPIRAPTDSAFCEQLQRMVDDVSLAYNELKDRESELEASIKMLFETEKFRQEEYELHSIVIHSGEDNCGHYWSYIRLIGEDGEEHWYKMNDSVVEKATIEQLNKDAMGDLLKTSAYFAVYVKKDQNNFTSMPNESLEIGLPEDLLEYIRNKNEAFNREIHQHKLKHLFTYSTETFHERVADFTIHDPWNKGVPLDKELYGILGNYKEFTKDAQKLNDGIEITVGHEQRNEFRARIENILMDYIDRILFQVVPTQNNKRDELQNKLLKMKDPQALFDIIIERLWEPSFNQAPDHLIAFWKSTGLGIFYKVIRYWVMFLVNHTQLPYLNAQAGSEIHHLERQDHKFHYYKYCERMILNFEALWHCYEWIRRALEAMINAQDFRVDCPNDYLAAWSDVLIYGIRANYFHDLLVTDLRKHAASLRTNIWTTNRYANQRILRGIVIIPVLKLVTLVGNLFKTGCNLVTELPVSHKKQLCYALKQITEWSKSTEGEQELNNFCLDVANFVTSVLDMIIQGSPAGCTQALTAVKMSMMTHTAKNIDGVLINSKILPNSPQKNLQQIEQWKPLFSFQDDAPINAFIAVHLQIIEEIKIIVWEDEILEDPANMS